MTEARAGDDAARARIRVLREMISEQRTWIEEHGRNLSGYRASYGSILDPDHDGDGGEAIYAADCAALERLLIEYRILTGDLDADVTTVTLCSDHSARRLAP